MQNENSVIFLFVSKQQKSFYKCILTLHRTLHALRCDRCACVHCDIGAETIYWAIFNRILGIMNVVLIFKKFHFSNKNDAKMEKSENREKFFPPLISEYAVQK